MSIPGGGAAHKLLHRVAFGCLFVLPVLGSGPIVAATSGAAVPKDDPWTVGREESVSIQIPRVADRPIGADAGPKVRVSAFNLNIDPALEAVLEPATVSQLRTIAERRRAEQPPEGFSITEMEQVSTAITEYLRSRGFIVSYAYLPSQRVDGGQVEIGVLSGTLERVVVEGNHILSSERIRLPFQDLMGQPLRNRALERAILRVRDYPGLAPSAVLSPGTETGTTNLTLRVLERRFDVGLIADNYGSKETGDRRARLQLGWNNPLGLGDQLVVNVLQTFSPSEGTFGGAAYEVPVGWPGFRVGAFYDENTFDYHIGSFDITGESKTGGVYGIQQLVRSREMNINMRLALESKEASFDGGEDLGIQQDNLSIGSISLDVEAVDRIGALGVNSLALGYYHGFPDLLGSMDRNGIGEDGEVSTRRGAVDRAGGEFDKVDLRYQRLQQLSEANSLMLRAFGQYTRDLLTPLEQMTLGGPYTVRAYPTAEHLSDRGAFGSVEYTLNVASLLDNAPAGWDLNLSLFFDYAWGETLQPLASEEQDVDLAGYGAGVHYEYRWGNGNGLLFRVEVATPTTGPEPSNGRDPQYWVRVEYFRR